MTLGFQRNRSTMRTESSLMTLLLALVCAFFSSAITLVPYNLYTLILSFILPTYACRESKHVRKLDKKQDWLHQELLQKAHCLWLPAQVTGKLTGSLDPSSPPSPCTPYGSCLTSKKVGEVLCILQTVPTPSLEIWKSP